MLWDDLFIAAVSVKPVELTTVFALLQLAGSECGASASAARLLLAAYLFPSTESVTTSPWL